jgi:hypothetical protein
MKYDGEKLGKDQVTRKRKEIGRLIRSARKHAKKFDLAEESSADIVRKAKDDLKKEIKKIDYNE